MAWRKTPGGVAAIEKGRDESTKKRSRADSDSDKGGGRNDGDGVSNSKRQKKYQNAVIKAAKKIIASTIEADNAEDEVLDTKLEATFNRRGNISSTAVVTPAKDKVIKNKATKLSSILGRINLAKNNVTIREDKLLVED